MQILTSAQGWLLIGVFFVAMFSVIALLPKERKTKRYSGLNLAVYRHILNMISGGDMKSRTYRAFMIDLNASLRQSCGYE